jgi:hypothetical protein
MRSVGWLHEGAGVSCPRMIIDSFGKLHNQNGEMLAEGNCQVDFDRGSVTMRPIIDNPLLVRQDADLWLELENGSQIPISARIIRFRLNVPGVPPGPAYRLHMAGHEGQHAAGAEGR